MTARPLAFAMTALDVAMRARTGQVGPRDGLQLVLDALDASDLPDGAWDAVHAMVGALSGREDVAAAGLLLGDWLARTYPAETPPEPMFDWQRRADCGL